MSGKVADSRRFLYITAGILVAAVLISSSILIAPESAATKTSTTTATTTSTITQTSTQSVETVTSTLVSTVTSSPSAAAGLAYVIPVGGTPETPTFDSTNGDVYVANYNRGAISVISGATNSVVANITVGDIPVTPLFDPANGDLYVSNLGSDTISVISGANNTVVSNLPVGAGPRMPTFDPSNGDIYVPDSGGDTVAVIAGDQNIVVANVTVGTGPTTPTFDPANNRIYVPDANESSISVISGATNGVIATVPVGSVPWISVLDPSNGDLYVPDQGLNLSGDTISVVSTATNSVVATLGIGQGPITPAFDPDNGYVYAPCIYCGDRIAVISGDSNAIVVNVTLTACPDGSCGTPVTNSPLTPMFNPSNGDLYVPNNLAGPYIANPALLVMSGQTNTVVASVNLSSGALTPVLDPNNGDVYVVTGPGGLYPANHGVSVSAEPSGPGAVDVIGPSSIVLDNGQGRLYEVTFVEGTGCYSSYISPWGVTLGALSITEPSNYTVSQIPEDGFSGTSHFNMTSIVFSVPSGVYQFTVYPTSFARIAPSSDEVGGGSSGTLTVTNSDVTIDVIMAVVCA